MAKEQPTVLVTGAGGFAGHHLVRFLAERGFRVRGVDRNPPKYEPSAAQEFECLDLRRWPDCLAAARGIEEVYHLAAHMGGVGFLDSQNARILHDNALISIHMLEAARINGAKRFLFTSSAFVYPKARQLDAHAKPLKEDEAYPADPDGGYGWEKLFTERLCRHYHEDYGLKTHVARLHNFYGPFGPYDGGRERSPSAICRKVALAKEGDEIEVWGDGEQSRSYCYVSDCVEGLFRLIHSDLHQPVNLGDDRSVTVNELVDIVAGIAGKKIRKRHDLSRPQGVRGRNADLSLIRREVGWEPKVSLEEGLARTYWWIHGQLVREGRIPEGSLA